MPDILLVTILVHIVSWIAAFACEWSREKWKTTKRFTFLWVIVGELLIVAGIACQDIQAATLALTYSGVVGLPFIAAAVAFHTHKDEADLKERKAEEILGRVEEG